MKPDLPDRLAAIRETVSEWDAPITAAEDLAEAAVELRRLQLLLNTITKDAEWCGYVTDDVAMNVRLWNLPRCDGRRSENLIEAATAAGGDE